jgi:PAS domain S-box-containing protein
MKRFLLGWLLATLLLAPATRVRANPGQILILHSYHKSDWTDNIMRGIQAELGHDADLKVEYMDTKQLVTAEYVERLLEIYRMKYGKTSFEAVITSDENAFHFAMKHHRDLFRSVPVSFCGLNLFEPAYLEGHPGVTGVLETGDFQETLALARILRPRANAVHVVVDGTETGRINLDNLRKVVAASQPDLKVEVLQELNLDELGTRMDGLPKNDFAFFISFWRDREGKGVTPAQVGTIFRRSPIPVFGRSEWMIGLGQLGGKCVSGFHQGQATARLVKGMLAEPGKPAPPVQDSPNKFMFDWPELVRHRIDPEKLPADSLIFNRPPSFYEEYKLLVWVSLAVILALLAMVASLVVVIIVRRRSSVALRASEAQNRALLEAVPDLILLLDREGSFLLVHTGSPDLLFLPPDDLVGKRVPEIFPPALSEMFMSAIRSTLLTLSQQRIEYCIPLAVGERHFEARLVPCAAQTVLAVARDITARKQAEAERERLIGELEMRNAELERFTYTVSHDLKSPLVTIRGFLGYLEQSALAGDAAGTRADVGRIRQATDKMDRLLRELLELSRAGRAMKPPEPVALGDVVREALAAVEGRLREQGIAVEVAPGLPVVLGDRTRLTEVVQNLLDNAVKCTGNGPQPRIEIGVRPPGADGMPVVFVRDNGVGIDPRYTERVFGLFEKLDPKSEGTGIGLALVRRIVEVHGGRVWVESEGEGRGATFCFTLPTARKGDAA